MIELTSESWFTITGRGRCAVVALEQLDGQAMQIGDRVTIDGTEYFVVHFGVLRRADPGQLRIGIMVREVTLGNRS